MSTPYTQDITGIYRPTVPVQHRDDEYDQSGFDMLFQMQEKHFWYRGRHRFLLAAVDRFTRAQPYPLSAIDLGGGVGGWVRYLSDRRAQRFPTLALADSSETALTMAKRVLPLNVARYQIDLMNLVWEDKWDAVFMLDVIEHLPNDAEAVYQATKALRPGGYLFITAPALQQFWSYNDELVHHKRRYNRKDFLVLGQRTGLELCDARYFMFLLSPIYWLTRRGKNIADMNEEQRQLLLRETHKIPPTFLNKTLAAIFCSESSIGHVLRLPWGTSILGVFRKI